MAALEGGACSYGRDTPVQPHAVGGTPYTLNHHTPNNQSPTFNPDARESDVGRGARTQTYVMSLRKSADKAHIRQSGPDYFLDYFLIPAGSLYA